MCCKVCVGSILPVGCHWAEVPICGVWRGWPPPWDAAFAISMLVIGVDMPTMATVTGAGATTVGAVVGAIKSMVFVLVSGKRLLTTGS
jgi:hypothetical protein